MTLWTLTEIVSVTNGTVRGHADWHITGVNINTRSIEKGNIFIALVGENFDGHTFIADAYTKGACGAIVSTYNPNIAIPQIIVNNTEEALHNLAVYARNRSSAKFIAITGSVGKTSTKDLLCQCLTPLGKTYATLGNLNNHYGVPITLCNMPTNTQYAIIEMGMSNAGEIAYLTNIGKPNIAIVTSIEPAHMEFFNSLEDIAHAKAEIFLSLNNGIAIINADTNHSDILQHTAQKFTNHVLTYSMQKNATLHHTTTTLNATKQNITATLNNTPIHFTLATLGTHRIYNAMAVLLCVDSLGIDIQKVLPTVSQALPSDGRGSAINISLNNKDILLFDETYNASPHSVIASLNTVGQTPTAGNRIAVLGDMLELGDTAKDYHIALLDTIIDNNIDKIYACGKNIKHLYDVLPVEIQGKYAQYSKDLIQPLLQNLGHKDTVVIKGSLGMNMKSILDALVREK